jgi:GNAT superfamily N-acetyltransferase
MADALVVVTAAMTDPDAAALSREMTLEVAALYGDDPNGPSGFTPEMFSPPEGRFLVGYLDGRPVAIAAFRRIDTDLARVHRVYVRPEARGRGMSRRMMGHLEALATAAGYRRLELETGTRQPAARRVYESLGYTPVPSFPPYENDPISCCYAKALA